LEDKNQEDRDQEECTEVKIVFTNQRVGAWIGRTLKTDIKDFEFIKFGVSQEADIPDGADDKEARGQIFRKLMEDIAFREVLIRSSYGKDDMAEIVRLIEGIVADAKREKQMEDDNDNNVSKQDTTKGSNPSPY
jgi:hypothetical protein